MAILRPAGAVWQILSDLFRALQGLGQNIGVGRGLSKLNVQIYWNCFGLSSSVLVIGVPCFLGNSVIPSPSLSGDCIRLFASQRYLCSMFKIRAQYLRDLDQYVYHDTLGEPGSTRVFSALDPHLMI
jgi:hypothetical protein